MNLKLSQLAQRFADHHHSAFTWDEAVSAGITARCTEVDSGARNIDFILTQTVLPQLSTGVLERVCEQRPFDAVHMALGADGQFTYTFHDAPLGAGGAVA